MPETVLRVRDLRKAYQDVVAVNGLDLEVRAGECFGLLGPNGAGKTTTIEICEGFDFLPNVRDSSLGRAGAPCDPWFPPSTILGLHEEEHEWPAQSQT